MDEFRDRADEPDHGRPDHGDGPGRPGPATDGDADAIRARVEPRSRAECAADLRQRSVSGWEPRPFTPRLSAPVPGPHPRPADTGADGLRGPERPADPLEVVRRFEPRRAGLPDISTKDAVAYVEAHHGQRPWLAAARACLPEVQRVFAALDSGGGHAHIRHEGWVTEEMNERRVAFLQDPAQLDPAKRAAGIDGLRQDEMRHQCRQTATRVVDPDAFAVAFTRGLEHPQVRAALGSPYDADGKPWSVQLPIEALLGPDGHRYCTGWRLEPVDGSMGAARKSREAWIATPAGTRTADGAEPTARPVETFDGGTLVFVFGHNRVGDGYEVRTMYPREPQRES